MRRVLITGATRRLGLVLAEAVAASGAAVALHARKRSDVVDRAVETVAARGGPAIAVTAELNDLSQVRRLVAEAAEKLGGPLTGLVNNASTFAFDSAHALDSDVFDEAVRVNLKAPIHLCETFQAQTVGEVDNCIVNILDQKLWNPNPDFFSYSLTKYALLGATEMLAVGFAPRVRVTAVAPGILFPSFDQSDAEFAAVAPQNPLRRRIDPAEVARAVVFLLESHSLTGQVLHVDNGQRFVTSPRDIMFSARGGGAKP